MPRASRPHSRSSSGHDSVRLFTHGCATTRRCCSRPIGPSQQPQAKGARFPRPLNGYSITTTSSKSKSARSARIFRRASIDCCPSCGMDRLRAIRACSVWPGRLLPILIAASDRKQIREIRQDLPPSFYRLLPKLRDGPFEGYPRVLGVAWAFVAHTDSRFDPDSLRGFVRAYQRVQPLTIGELWAVAITLRVVLVENLSRAAARIVSSRAARQGADALADRLLGVNGYTAEPDALRRDTDRRSFPPAFTVQLLQRLRDQDPRVTPALHWLEELLAAQGTTADAIVRDEQQRQGASNVTVRNLITSMRLLSDVDWPEFFESVSLVDDLLRSGSDFAALDFPTRDLYRRAIERFARGSKLTELEIAAAALSAANEYDATGDGHGDCRRADPGYYLIANGQPAFEATIGYRNPRFTWPGRFVLAAGVGNYLAAIAVVGSTALSLPLFVLNAWSTPGAHLVLLALLGLIPSLDVAIALVNRAVMRAFGATTLPGLALHDGIPSHLRTMVVVPALLTTRAALEAQIARLEI